MYNVSAIVNETSNPYNHRLELGRTGVNQWDFYEYGGVFNFYRCQDSNGENKVILFKINNGSVGILTDTPTHTLHVNGTGYFSNTLSVASQIRIGNGTITWDSTKGCFHFSHGLYSDSFISAMGLNDSGSGGGSASYERLDNWTDYAEEKATWVLSAKLGNELNERLKSVEAGGATSVVTTGTGNVITAISKNGNTITATKGITALTSHQAIYSLTLQGNGTTIGTFNPKSANATINITAANIGAAAASHTHTLSALSDLKAGWSTLLKEDPKAYVTRWPAFSEVTSKPTTLAGYGITDAYTKTDADSRYVNVSGDTMTGSLTVRNSNFPCLHLQNSGYDNNYLEIGNGLHEDFILRNATSGGNIDLRFNQSRIVYNNNTIWHEGNDGSGSGLDADLLDGVHLGGLFTDFSTSDVSTKITIGGVTKSLKINADTLDGLHYTSFPLKIGGGIYNTPTNRSLKLLTFRRGNEKGWLRLSISDSNNASMGVCSKFIVRWGYDSTNSEKGINLSCIYSIIADASTSLTAVRVDGVTFALYYTPNNTASKVQYLIEGYSDACTITDTNATAEPTPTPTYTSALVNIIGNLQGNADTAKKLATPRTLWGQNFDGSANVSGLMTSVYGFSNMASIGDTWSDGTNSHIWYGYDGRYPNTGVYSATISDYFGLSLKTESGNISLTRQGYVGIGTFSPSAKLHIVGDLFINTGDPTLKIYSGMINDTKSDGNICLQTNIDTRDGETQEYPTQYPQRCNLVLQPRGGQVYVGMNPDGGDSRYKLLVMVRLSLLMKLFRHLHFVLLKEIMESSCAMMGLHIICFLLTADKQKQVHGTASDHSLWILPQVMSILFRPESIFLLAAILSLTNQ